MPLALRPAASKLIMLSINLPQTAVLGIHSIKERAVVVNGQIVIRPIMIVALTYDHRLLDGRESVTMLGELMNAWWVSGIELISQSESRNTLRTRGGCCCLRPSRRLKGGKLAVWALRCMLSSDDEECGGERDRHDQELEGQRCSRRGGETQRCLQFTVYAKGRDAYFEISKRRRHRSNASKISV